ncbi:hypothetical protein HCN44_007150 [Aphidius gifuensis]|uniref:Uncharacterized protein n=1 Tax=Aphidius gifuensis TaxID=684658 RepID=A0A834XP62_APHGI|nr:VPS35 endosomal protein-sorting factor-like [Aphidius gifuensis]KAF7988840.1 hypothetical protein HCN44_007150 [Aphidius gifuensis]
MAEISWISCRLEHSRIKKLQSEEVQDHPLKPVTISIIDNGRSSGIRRGTIRSGSTSSSTGTSTPVAQTPINISINEQLTTNKLDGTDPLSQFARDELDPLTKMATDEWDYSSTFDNDDNKKLNNTNNINNNNKKLDESWKLIRNEILNKYTTSEKLTIVTSFLSDGEKSIKLQQSTTTIGDKVRKRLEQLDDFEDITIRKMSDLTQQEYVIKIEQLNNELIQAWNTDQRVKSLKIAIQCSKLLVDITGIDFYPSKFILITDILDIFGKLVYERLKLKSEQYINDNDKNKKIILTDNFTSDMIPESAKETCRNWFYKIASIRELVPRLYLEISILKSYSFLNNDEYNNALIRLTKMIRGIGNPLISIYARCYLCRVGINLPINNTFNFIYNNFNDFLLIYHQLFNNHIKMLITKQNITQYIYLNLYKPALDWIIKIMIDTITNDNILIDILNNIKKQKYCGLLLNSIFIGFKKSFISSRVLEFIDLIGKCDNDSGYPQYILYRNLTECLTDELLPVDVSLKIKNIIWQFIINLKDTKKFMYCTEIWIKFVIKNFNINELNNILGEIINNISSLRNKENYYKQLQLIIDNMLKKINDIELLLIQDNFLPIIDLFHKENIKIDVCKNIIDTFYKQHGIIIDPIIINSLIFLTKIMHDSVTALTVDDEKRQIGNLICLFIQRVNYDRDFEKQLNFYVESRGIFTNLDIVNIQLVQCVNHQSIETRKIVRGYHTRRTSAFVRACAAYSFITIPSLKNVQIRLQLYLLSGQIALLNQCYGQADACFKAALTLVQDMPKIIDIDGRKKTSDIFLIGYLSNFLSTLLVVPDSPDNGVLYLMRGLLNVVKRYFDDNSIVKYQFYLKVLDLLATMTRENYPYHVDKVDSNDKLYGSDDKYIGEVDKICGIILNEILGFLKHLGNTEQFDKQSAMAVELFGRILMRGDLTKSSMANLAVSLWNLSQKHGCADPKMRAKTIEYMKRKSRDPNFEHLSEILCKITQKL